MPSLGNYSLTLQSNPVRPCQLHPGKDRLGHQGLCSLNSFRTCSFTCSTQSFPSFHCRDVWRMYLERGEFDLAKEYSKVWVYIHKPPINFCAILLAILRTWCKSKAGYRATCPVRVDVCPPIFRLQKIKTKQSKCFFKFQMEEKQTHFVESSDSEIRKVGHNRWFYRRKETTYQ